MRILSLDIAFRYTGISIWQDGKLEKTGIIQVDRKRHNVAISLFPENKCYIKAYLPQKYKNEELLQIIIFYKLLLMDHLPPPCYDHVIGETTFFGFQSAKAASQLSIISTLFMCFYEDKFQIIQPSVVKKFIRESTKSEGIITKQLVQRWVNSQVSIAPELLPKQRYLQEHIYDSIAAYLVYKKKQEI